MRIILYFIAFLINFSVNAQTTKNVLFVGNSYTYVNDLPLIISKLAVSTGDVFNYNSSAPGGYTLQGHSTNVTTLSLIQQGGWDYVVLQDQSQRPSFPMSQVSVEVFPYAKILCDSIRSAEQCAKPLFFMTWGRKYGDAGNCAYWPPVCTYQGMDSLLNLRYRMLADSNDAYVSPVGAVWHYIIDNHATIDLYTSDNSHPSLSGSYAAACTFYSLIFQKDPTAISDDYGLSAADALAIRNAAKLIAYDSLAKWNIGKYNPIAKFSINQTCSSALFSNMSLNASSYLWDFGDGDTSTVFEPFHIYAQTGTYDITLKAMNCEAIDSVIHNITVTVGVNQSTKNMAKLFPNPIKNFLTIEFDRIKYVENIKLFSMEGKLIKTYSARKTKSFILDFEDISSGIYFLSYEIDNAEYRNKLIVE